MDVIALVLWSSLILLGVGAKPRWIEDLSRTTAMVAAAGALALALLPHTESLCRNLLRRLACPPRLGSGCCASPIKCCWECAPSTTWAAFWVSPC